MQDVTETRTPLWQDEVIQREWNGLTEADDIDSLTVLRHEMGPIHNAVAHVVAKRLECPEDDREGTAMVVADQVTNVLQKERPGAPRVKNADHIMKQRSLGSTKPMRPS